MLVIYSILHLEILAFLSHLRAMSTADAGDRFLSGRLGSSLHLARLDLIMSEVG